MVAMILDNVSTHSRPKAAGDDFNGQIGINRVSTHSRPKAAGTSRVVAMILENVSTHSRPKAAGRRMLRGLSASAGFNSQPPEGGWILLIVVIAILKAFQLTAARRRLVSRMHNG